MLKTKTPKQLKPVGVCDWCGKEVEPYPEYTFRNKGRAVVHVQCARLWDQVHGRR